MKQFCVLYGMPVAGLEAWMSKSEGDRKQEEDKVRGDWDAWLAAHADTVKNTIGLGKTKKVSASGVEDAKNGLMLSSYVMADSLEAAADLFKDHPHLQIPGATIEVMEIQSLDGK